MFLPRALSRNQNSHGSVLVELALILPLMLSLTFGSFEIAKLIRFQQTLSVVSREGANAAFRECSTSTTPSSCLDAPNTPNDVWGRINRYQNTVIPGAEIILSIYRYDSATLTISLVGQTGIDPMTGQTPAGRKSHFTPGPLDPNNPNPPTDLYRAVPANEFGLGSINSGNPTIAIAEVFYLYRPGISPRLPFFSYVRKSFYEVTIL